MTGWVFPPITPDELQDWAAFERVDGPILIHDRIEMSIGIAALISAAPYSAKGKDLKLYDFMPHWDPTAPKPSTTTPEDIMASLVRLSKKGQAAAADSEAYTEEVPFYGSDSNVHPESSY